MPVIQDDYQTPEAVLLIATQLLMHRAGSPLRINAPFHWHSGSARACNAITERGAKRCVAVRIDPQYCKTLINGIMHSNGPDGSALKWLSTGQVDKGGKQIALYGSHGNCEILWSQRTADQYEADRPWLRKNMVETMFDTRVARHPEQQLLAIYGNEEADEIGQTFVLPPDDLCETVYAALQGKPSIITDCQRAHLTPVIATGLDIFIAPIVGESGRFVLSSAQDAPRALELIASAA